MPALTISNEERLKVKLEAIQVDQNQYESLKAEFEKFKEALEAMQQGKK